MKIRNVRSAIRALTNQKRDLLTEDEIYKSRQMKDYLQDMSKAVCGDACNAPNVSLVGGGPDGLTACTDGDSVVINYESYLCRFFSTPESRFMAVMGMFFHELAHVLYNDFGAEEQAMERLNRGLFYGDEPIAATKEAQNALIEMKDALANPLFSPVFGKIYHDLNNTVIDPHDEGKIMDEFGGLAIESIMKIVEALRAYSVPLEEIEERVKNKKCSRLTAMYSLILEYVRFGRILCSDEQIEKNSEFMQVLYSISSRVETARWTDDPRTRFSELNAIVLALWPFIQEELNENQNGGSNQQPQQRTQSGDQHAQNQQPTQAQIQQVLQQLDQGAKAAPHTHAPQGKSSKRAKENAQIARAGQQATQKPGQTASGSQASKEALNAAFKGVANQLAQEIAENELEREQANEIQRAADERLSQTSSHRDIPVEVDRITEVSDEDIAKYNKEMAELSLYSKRMQKQMLEIMKDLQMGGLNRHKAFGRIICPKDAYRPDELMFANKKQPIDLPDMAVAVLVDHSGSMARDSRIEMSCRAAILLHDFARGIGIPVAVCGHRSHFLLDRGIQYIVYTDFDQYSERDRYRLAKMRASGRNRDGAAIEIAASRLEQRPEKLKLLIAISDGKPNHDNYGGKDAEEDIRSIVDRYRRKGVEIVGAAIGEDRDVIARIYGDGYLDITDLSTLPKTLTKLVQKRLLSQIV